MYHPLQSSRELFNRKSVSNKVKISDEKDTAPIETYIIGSKDEKLKFVKSSRIRLLRPASAYNNHQKETFIDKNSRPRSAQTLRCHPIRSKSPSNVEFYSAARPQSGKMFRDALKRSARCRPMSGTQSDYLKPKSIPSNPTPLKERLSIVGTKSEFSDTVTETFSCKSPKKSSTS